MTYYVILDSTANLVDSFDHEVEARAALERICREAPEVADEYAIVTYDEQGYPQGNTVVGSELDVSTDAAGGHRSAGRAR
jgi:hypothetical protein